MGPRFLLESLYTMVEDACRSETNQFGYGIWTHHILQVVRFGKLLAKQLGADAEVVEIAALLHDYASIKNHELGIDHHIHSAQEAERVLQTLEYAEVRIAAVQHCIIAHRGSVHVERTTPEAVCLASADAMAHIDQASSLLYLAFVRLHLNIDDGSVWVCEKLTRSWNKLCPEAKRMMHAKYDAAQLLLCPGETIRLVEAENPGVNSC